jgi:hypothetical protein
MILWKSSGYWNGFSGLLPHQQRLIAALVNELEAQNQATENARRERNEAIAAYAEQFGATEMDLDKDFEPTSIEHWPAEEARYQ